VLPNKLKAGQVWVLSWLFVLKLVRGPTCANAAGTTVPNRDIAVATTTKAAVVVLVVVIIVVVVVVFVVVVVVVVVVIVDVV